MPTLPTSVSAREKGSLGRMSLTVKIADAVQEHEEVICSVCNYGKNVFFVGKFNSDGINL